MVLPNRSHKGVRSIDTAIEFSNVSRRFGSREAVSELTLAVPQGAVVGFLGPNGAGKTTTVRLLVGMLNPSSGGLLVLGLDPVRQGEQVRARIGVVLDQVGLYDRLTAYQNLEFHARIHRLPRAEAERRIHRLLERVGLWERRGDHVSGFSRGMRQQLGFARALLSEPELLILDEPTAGLDPENIVRVRELLRELADEGGRTIFLCTHLLDEAERLCSEIAIIQGGRLRAHGAPRELEGGREPTVRLRLRGPTAVSELPPLPEGVGLTSLGGDEWQATLSAPDDVEALVATLVRAGVGIRAVTPVQESLEDVYLRVVGGGRRE